MSGMYLFFWHARHQYHAQVTDLTRRVRFTAGAGRIWHIYRVAADSKSASSLRSLPQNIFSSI